LPILSFGIVNVWCVALKIEFKMRRIGEPSVSHLPAIRVQLGCEKELIKLIHRRYKL
jgi:hypothetical protein